MLPMGLTILDLSAYVGLAAVGAITLNMLLGLLMAFRYSPHRSWPHHRFNYFRVHDWTGYIALTVAILHPAILLFNKDPRFRILDLLYPVHSPSQPLDNTIGAIALYLLTFVVVTSYLRIRLGRHLWKSFHFSIYFAAAALFWHSLFTDPDLKNKPVDWSDGGKLFVECCLLLIAAISLLRLRHARKKALHSRHLPVTIKTPL
ncbi:MAG TPA: ferric reductase-like transmembrane domain-containing protein [Candidatus Acidoferrum sp.]